MALYPLFRLPCVFSRLVTDEQNVVETSNVMNNSFFVTHFDIPKSKVKDRDYELSSKTQAQYPLCTDLRVNIGISAIQHILIASLSAIG